MAIEKLEGLDEWKEKIQELFWDDRPGQFLQEKSQNKSMTIVFT